MKNCPTCGTSYTDDTLVFCLQDGATLQPSAATNPLSLMATLRGDSQQTEDATRDASASSSAPTAQIPASALPTAVYQAPRPTSDHASAGASAQQPPNTARTILITAVVTVLLITIGGIGAWLFFRGGGDGRGRERRAAQANSANSDSSAEAAAGTSNEAQSNNQGRGDGTGDKGGRWFVVLASFPKADIERATERMEALRKQGIDARIESSDDYPNFKSGLWVIVIGPVTRNNAEEILEQVRPKVRDAYTKSGW